MSNEEPTVSTLFQLVTQYGWSTFIALLFLAMYFGWLPDPRRTEAERLVKEFTVATQAVHNDMGRVVSQHSRMFSMLTELCLAMQRHDNSSVGTCGYVHQDLP